MTRAMDKEHTSHNRYDGQELKEFTPILNALRKDAVFVAPRKELLSEILSVIDERAPARVPAASFWRFTLSLGAVGVAVILLAMFQTPSPQSQKAGVLSPQNPFATPSAAREDAATSPETSVTSFSPSLSPKTTATSTTPLESNTQP